MQMYIPEISDIITLTSDWTFKLHNEYRNDKLIQYMFVYPAVKYDTYFSLTEDKNFPKDFTFPAGTQLKIKRIYVRQGASDYSSLTFSVVKTSLPIKGTPQFWAKISDVNNIQFEVALTSVGK